MCLNNFCPWCSTRYKTKGITYTMSNYCAMTSILLQFGILLSGDSWAALFKSAYFWLGMLKISMIFISVISTFFEH